MADRLEEFLHATGQPLPLFVVGDREAGILLAVFLEGPAEEDLPADHPDAGAVAQDIGLLFLPESADHGNPAGHELGKGIADASQNPELRRLETGVVLGHRHSPRPDIPVDKYLPLGHRVGNAIGGISTDDDPGAGVEPAHVVGSGSRDVDQGVGETHRTDALPGCPQDPDGEGLIPRPPEAAANPVLAEGSDFDVPVAVGDGLLYPFLKNSRIHPDAFFRSGNHDGWFVRHDDSLLLFLR